ncbi:hypothetical protein D3C72_782890 [compost metagenome]
MLFKQIVQITFGRGFAVHALIDAQGAPRAQHLIRPIAQLQRHGLGGGQAFDLPGTHGQLRGLAAHHVLKVDRQHVLLRIAFDFVGIGVRGPQPFSGLCQQRPDIGRQYRLRGDSWFTEVIFTVGAGQPGFRTAIDIFDGEALLPSHDIGTGFANQQSVVFSLEQLFSGAFCRRWGCRSISDGMAGERFHLVEVV